MSPPSKPPTDTDVLIARLECKDDSWDCACGAGNDNPMHHALPPPACPRILARPYPFELLKEAATELARLSEIEKRDLTNKRIEEEADYWRYNGAGFGPRAQFIAGAKFARRILEATDTGGKE